MHAVVFDIDGTLVDSVDFHAKAWQAALHDFGHDVRFEDIRHQIGKGGDQLMPVFLSEQDVARDGEAIEARRKEIFGREYLPRVVGFANVRELFSRLRGDGIRVALASSAAGDELDSYKRIANIRDLVDVETSSDDADKSKPHPDIFEAVLGKLGAHGTDVIVVGDTPYDAISAARAGLKTLGVTCGGWSEVDLRIAGCIDVYKDPADLLASYDSWTLSRP